MGFDIMRGFGLWVCFMVMLTSIHFISSSSLPDMIFPVYESSATALTHNRKLMVNGSIYIRQRLGVSNFHEKNNKGIGNVNLEDYQPVDPAPSSKAAVKTGPIEHGTPLMPHIPRPGPPPSNLKHTVSPSLS